ncbi:MAG TPA: ferritin-like domain-containing protein [Thermoanaerobaculia bacterium]|nr:ferritin-like domain-containing protein [Thermoanaerobaculia bacterium]
MSDNTNLDNLKVLYVDELKDAYDFEHQILDALPKMEEAASDSQLKRAFQEHRRETENQVRRLEQVFNHLGRDAERKTCKGMKGVISEGEDYVKASGDGEVIDAALISAAQRVEHYEMAVYGSLRTYARALGFEDQAELLQQNLSEEKAADEKLTGLAESGSHVKATVGSR